MNRRVLLSAIAVALTVPATAALAQEPIVFGVITPLSPPGETSLGQQVKRGSEIAVEYLNEKGGVLGRKVVLSIQDSAGKNEQAVAAYRRLVTNEKAVHGTWPLHVTLYVGCGRALIWSILEQK